MYDDFARIYDRFQEIEYDKFVEFYEEIFGDGKPKTIIDLGCGSGNITIPLAKRGYKAAGIDISAEMLSLDVYKRQIFLFIICVSPYNKGLCPVT